MNKTAKEVKNVDAYIKAFPKNVQLILKRIRQEVKRVAPQTTETISYQMPTYKLEGKNLVHFAAFAKHIGFYPTPSGIEAFKKELAQYKGAKGSVQFPLDNPIPYTLISKIVKYRLKETLANFKHKKQ